jgi:hypothetical protein
LFADYAVRFDYYATELCENKNQPEKKCNGLCQVNKELSANENQESPQVPISVEISVFLVVNFMLKIEHVVEGKHHIRIDYLDTLSSPHFLKLLKPPTNLV